MVAGFCTYTAAQGKRVAAVSEVGTIRVDVELLITPVEGTGDVQKNAAVEATAQCLYSQATPSLSRSSL